MHRLCIGLTGSGKSTLMKKLCSDLNKKHVTDGKTMVLDPIHDPNWEANYKTHEPEVFFNAYWKSRNCNVFFDECGLICENFKNELQQCATLGRHLGHLNHFIAQRAMQIPKTARDQCTELFIFAVSQSDATTLAEDFNQPLLEQAPMLKRGEFYHVKSFQGIEKLKIF